MTTDCIMGMVSYPIYLIVVFTLLSQFSWWDDLVPAFLSRPAGQSFINPFDTAELRDFNLFYVFVGIFGAIYSGGLSWQGTQGYNAAAINAHEQKMTRILGTWGGLGGTMLVLTAMVAFAYMHSPTLSDRASHTTFSLETTAIGDMAPDYAPLPQGGPVTAGELQAAIAHLKDSDPAKYQTYETIKKQMLVPTVIRDILPVGVLGLFCALMIFLMISTDSSYLHSWGSILVQDIYLPWRKKPLTPQRQLLLLRLGIAAVAVYAFFFSLFFGQVTYILMFFAIIGAIWAGAGAVIVLGLYWPKGTTAGAWGALISGAGIAGGGFLFTNTWSGFIYPFLAQSPTALTFICGLVESISGLFEPYILWRVTSDKFFMNGQELNFLAMVTAIGAYYLLSFLTFREKFNMDRMLHRGSYARADEKLELPPLAAARKKGFGVILKTLSGIDANFTRGDKILSSSVIIWSLGWGFGSFLVILIWNIISPWPDIWWAGWGWFGLYIMGMIVGLVSTVLFSIGGTRDLILMFKRLKTQHVNVADDGRVIGHQNADDLSKNLEEL